MRKRRIRRLILPAVLLLLVICTMIFYKHVWGFARQVSDREKALREAFLVYWAYGESLYDVRILMHGGKVPLIKTSSDWHVPLNKLYYLETLLKKADRTAGHGEDYSDYLRLLLNMQFISTQKKRGLDLLEIDLRQEEGMAFFQADNCVIAMKDTCIWSISPVFSSVPSVFLGTRFSGGSFQTDSGFAY